MAVPRLTAEQRLAALGKANAARRARFELKDRLKRGEVTLAQVFDQAGRDDMIGPMRVSQLLAAMPGIAKATAHTIMTEMGIAPTRRLRGLSDRQRQALLARFGPA